MSDDKPKKSWREKDAMRDRAGSGAGKREPGARPSRAADRASKQYRSALDALFDKGGFEKVAEVLGKPAKATPATDGDDPQREELRKKIVEAIGRDEITRALDRWLARWPLPDDYEILAQALEHDDGARVEAALAQLDALLAREKPRRARSLIGKLRLLEETSRSTEIATRAASLRAKLPT